MKEGLRTGLLKRDEVFGIQSQLMLILRELIMTYTKGESTSIKTEKAEGLLNSILYSVDACISNAASSEEGIALLKSANIKEIYEKGVRLVTACVEETKLLYEEVAKGKLDISLVVYNSTIDEAIPDFFKNYGVLFEAHGTMCDMDYPLVFDDMKVQGIYYIRNYLENLKIENKFCNIFDEEQILKIIRNCSKIYGVNYIDSPINVFEMVINNAVLSVLAEGDIRQLEISRTQFEILQMKLGSSNTVQIEAFINSAFERLISDLKIEDSRIISYIGRYIPIFKCRVLNAIENNSLENIAIIASSDVDPDISCGYVTGSKMSDKDFRLLAERILKCRSTSEKINIIKSSVNTAEDLIDILNGDCLFGEEITVLFSTLNDMELAILGRLAFNEIVNMHE